MHCADLHLDSPFSLDDPHKAEQRRAELRCFASMMLFAKTEGVDLMLMAGDLFDSDYAGRDTAALMAREFASNPKCKFIIAPGNHDPYTPDSIWARYQFPEHVYIFDTDKLSYFSFDDIGVDVYGYAFTGPSMQHNPFAGKRPRNPQRINLLCAHGDLGEPTSPYCPIALDDVQKSGFDYIALGHIHNTTGIERAGNTYYGYSGCLEGRDFGETGTKAQCMSLLTKPSRARCMPRFADYGFQSGDTRLSAECHRLHVGERDSVPDSEDDGRKGYGVTRRCAVY